MRILHIDEQTGWRGGEQQASYLIQGLAQRGHLVAVAGRPGTPFTTVGHGLAKPLRITAPFIGEFDPVTLWRLVRAIKLHEFDIIHAHTSHAHTYACLAQRLAGRGKAVVSRRVDFVPKSNRLNRWKYSLPDKIVSVSRCIDHVMRDYGIEDKRRAIVHSTQDPARFDVEPLTRAELGVPGDGPLLGCVAALVGHKDHPTLLSAMKKVLEQSPDAHLLLIGDGELRQSIENLIDQLGIRRSVTLLGYRKDVPRIVRALDLFVLSSCLEGFGGVCIEAMFTGVPVVATAAGGVPETVINEKSGLLVPVKDPDALAKAILRVLRDGDLARTLVQSARAFAMEGFTVDHMVEGYIGVYESLLRG